MESRFFFLCISTILSLLLHTKSLYNIYFAFFTNLGLNIWNGDFARRIALEFSTWNSELGTQTYMNFGKNDVLNQVTESSQWEIHHASKKNLHNLMFLVLITYFDASLTC